MNKIYKITKIDQILLNNKLDIIQVKIDQILLNHILDLIQVNKTYKVNIE